MPATTRKVGQNETLTLTASTVANVFGASDTGFAQQRDVLVTVIGVGDVYLKVIPSTDTLIGLVSATDRHHKLTEADTLTTPMPIPLCPGEILVAVSGTTPTLKVRELIHV